MTMPRLSHLQFLVIGIVHGRELAGREIRAELKKSFGIRRSGPAFYQLMARLEDAGWVEGTYHQDVVEGQMIRERHYTVTVAGARAWRASRDFYVKAIQGFESTGGLAGA